MSTKILSVVGTRPQFIKAAVVSKALAAATSWCRVMVHTGQHYDFGMSSVFFEELGMPSPDHYLGIGSGGHGSQTGRILEAIEGVLIRERPDYVLVYGDSNSTLAGALAAVKLHVPVAHIEAGLRSFNRAMPEEINRVLTDHAADLLFAPTERALSNLQREGIASDRVRLVGDVMYDAALYYGEHALAQSRILIRLGLAVGSYVLCTIHRAENTDYTDKLSSIVGGLRAVATQLPVVWPLHPRTHRALEAMGLLDPPVEGIRFIDPVGYLDMLMLEKNSRLIATDSGGVQKEAFFHRVPCVTLRTETEWTELVELGWNRVVSPEGPDCVARAMLQALGAVGAGGSPYGSGDSSRNIARALIAEFQRP